MLAIYEVAPPAPPWDIGAMLDKVARKKDAEDDALRIARRLAKLQPANLSEKKWTERAEVSPSFFSNLRGRPNTGPSNPSVFQLRSILEAVGSSLSEFFAEEAKGRVTLLPTRPALEQLIAAALPGRPRQEGRLPEYLAEILIELLALPPSHLRQILEDAERDRAAAALPPEATKQA